VKNGLLRLSINQFKANWKKLTLYFLLLILASGLGSVRYQLKENDLKQLWDTLGPLLPVMGLYGLLSFCLTSIIGGVKANLLTRTARTGRVDNIGSYLSVAVSKFGRLLLQSLLLGLLVLGGALVVAIPIAIVGFVLFTTTQNNPSILLLLPVIAILVLAFVVLCVYISLRLSFVTYVVMDRDLTAWKSIKEAWALTKGKVGFLITRYLPLIGWSFLLVVATVVAVIISVILLPLLLVTIPGAIALFFSFAIVSDLYTANVYLEIIGEQGVDPLAVAPVAVIAEPKPEAPAGE
jgi:hypothetical protein